jgi:flagellar motor switch protein FliN
MSNQMLSQEEIDALLRGDSVQQEENESEKLDEVQQDAIGEIGNISFGSASTALSTLLNQKVEITTPTVSVVNKKNLVDEFPQPHVSVLVNYTEGFRGSNLLVIKTEDAKIIADLMLGGDGTNTAVEFSELHTSAVQEAMNQMMGSASTSMSTVFNKKIDISPPSIDIMNIVEGEGTGNIPKDEYLVKVAFNLKVGSLIDSNIMQLIPVEFAKELVQELMEGPTEQPIDLSSADTIQVNKTEENAPVQTPGNNAHSNQQVQNNRIQEQSNGNRINSQPANVRQVAFSEFEEPNQQLNESRNLDMLMDIPLQVTVELGRTKRKIKEILELTHGSIIELDKLAGEPVDILVNKKLIAKGEVVVIDENFGVRITEILSQRERLNYL